MFGVNKFPQEGQFRWRYPGHSTNRNDAFHGTHISRVPAQSYLLSKMWLPSLRLNPCFYKTLRLYHRSENHRPRDKHRRPKTSGWKVLDFRGNQFKEDELQGQWEIILQAPLVGRDSDCGFWWYLSGAFPGVVEAFNWPSKSGCNSHSQS